jgi:hypothetical protein
VNGAQLSFSSGTAVIVEHASNSELVGAILELPTVKGVTYRVQGEMRCADNTSPLPKVEVIAAQVSQRVYGEATAVDRLTNVDFSFLSAKSGARLQFRPGGRAMLSIKMEPVVELTPSTETQTAGADTQDHLESS